MTTNCRSPLFNLWFFAAALWCALALPVHAQDTKPVVVEGQRLAPSVVLAGADLQLNGSGVRAAGWFKAYVAALYLVSPASTAEQAVAQAGPKRLQLRLLQDVPAVEFSKALRKGVSRNFGPNTAEAEAARLEPQLARFEAQINALKKVRKGDVVDIDQDATGSLLFIVNGTLRGQTPAGSVLFVALLRAFVGDKPYDDKLKAGLLGQRP